MNYIMVGIGNLKAGMAAGSLIYIAVIVSLYVLKIRRSISRKAIYEWILCIYGVTLLRTTGIFTLDFSMKTGIHYNLMPFVGSSIVPVLLNFALFVPCGFLLPLAFPLCK